VVDVLLASHAPKLEPPAVAAHTARAPGVVWITAAAAAAATGIAQQHLEAEATYRGAIPGERERERRRSDRQK